MIKTNKILPTYKEAAEIVANHDIIFYETKHIVNGFDVSIYNYRLAWYDDFTLPVPSNPELDAFELRGFTVVFNKDGSVFKEYLLLDKFFNINQVEETMYDRIKSFEIDNIYSKEDGSIISFIKLPDGSVAAKSKASFDSYQALKANDIYKSDLSIKKLVDDLLDSDIVPIFEYVSPSNQVVLLYGKEELILIRLRDNKTGEYIDIDDYSKKYNVNVPTKWNVSLDELIERAETIEDVEGWVIRFKNGLMIKIKSKWYCDNHKLLTEDLAQEHFLVEKIVNEEVDDIISKLDNTEYHVFIKSKIFKISEIISKYLKDKEDDVLDLIKVFKETNDVKSFAIKYNKHKDFPFVMNLLKLDKLKALSDMDIVKHYGGVEQYLKILNGLELENQIKNHILDNTNKLMKAREWLLSLDSDIENYIK